ncbi:hypothetical protein [Paenibacillus sp. YYML68]|uniref:hypothetical protein n=1 Tax=Paenibacillus sp. YYML68 TaxID=2909250 RepID=UPI0024905ADF|nr:hypothetical protein [Paenibacillus sp. YYML68]
MIFQRSLFVKILFTAIFIGSTLLLYLFLNQNLVTLIIATIFLTVLTLIIGINYRVKDNKVSRCFFRIAISEVNINDINYIEFYREDKVGHFRITIASPEEDEYRICFNDGSIIVIPSYYMNGSMSIGDFLCNKYKTPKKITTRTKYFSGNP